MTTFGYELETESVNLFLIHEMHAYDKIDRKNKEVDALVTKMEDLEQFLSYIANKTDDSHRLDLTTAEEQQMVDHLREQGLDTIFPPGKYEWKDAEVETLTRKITQHIEGPLQRKINTLTEQMVLEQHELTKILEIFRSGLNRMINLKERILSNMAKH